MEPDENLRNVEEIIIPLDKKTLNTKQIEENIIKFGTR